MRRGEAGRVLVDRGIIRPIRDVNWWKLGPWYQRRRAVRSRQDALAAGWRQRRGHPVTQSDESEQAPIRRRKRI